VTSHSGVYLPGPSIKDPIRLLADQIPSRLARQDLALVAPWKRVVDGNRADEPAVAGTPVRAHGPVIHVFDVRNVCVPINEERTRLTLALRFDHLVEMRQADPEDPLGFTGQFVGDLRVFGPTFKAADRNDCRRNVVLNPVAEVGREVRAKVPELDLWIRLHEFLRGLELFDWPEHNFVQMLEEFHGDSLEPQIELLEPFASAVFRQTLIHQFPERSPKFRDIDF